MKLDGNEKDNKGKTGGAGLLRCPDSYPKLFAIVLTSAPGDVELVRKLAETRLQPELRRYGFETKSNVIINAVTLPGMQNVVNALNQACEKLCKHLDEGKSMPPLILVTLPKDIKADTYYPDVKW